MNKTIKLVQAVKSETKDIYLDKEIKNKVKLETAILYQNNHKTSDLDTNIDLHNAEVKIDNLS